jgi:hypothetical protein
MNYNVQWVILAAILELQLTEPQDSRLKIPQAKQNKLILISLTRA